MRLCAEGSREARAQRKDGTLVCRFGGGGGVVITADARLWQLETSLF